MVNPKFQVQAAFATPIVTARLADAGALNSELKKLFLAREAQGDRYRKKEKTPTHQVNIFESEFDLFSWPEPAVQQLRGFCLSTLSQALVELNDYTPAQLQMLNALELQVDCWFHVTRHGGYIGSHMHPMASWSGVYCVTPGETPVDHPDSGLLCIPDTRAPASSYLDPGNVRLKEPYGFGGHNFKQLGGDLILFPSYLPHATTPFYGRDERITVAFNCSLIRPKGQSFGF